MRHDQVTLYVKIEAMKARDPDDAGRNDLRLERVERVVEKVEKLTALKIRLGVCY